MNHLENERKIARDYLLSRASEISEAASQSLKAPGLSTEELKRVQEDIALVNLTLIVVNSLLAETPPQSEEIAEKELFSADNVTMRQNESIMAIITPDEDTHQAGVDEGKKTEKPKAIERGQRQSAIVYALMQPNEQRTDFKYKSAQSKDLVLEIYKDKLQDLSGKNLSTKLASLGGGAFTALKGFKHKLKIAIEGNGRVDPTFTELINNIRQIPEFKNTTLEQIYGYLSRDMAFPTPTEEPVAPTYIEKPKVEKRIIVLPDAIPGNRGIRTLGIGTPIVRRPRPVNNNEHIGIPTKVEVFDRNTFPLPELPDRVLTRQEQLAYSMMLINQSRNGFKYREFNKTTVDAIYSEVLSRTPKKFRQTVLMQFTDDARIGFESFIEDLKKYKPRDYEFGAPEESTAEKFVDWVQCQFIYEGTSVDQIIRILKRDIDVPQLIDDCRRYLELNLRDASPKVSKKSAPVNA